MGKKRTNIFVVFNCGSKFQSKQHWLQIIEIRILFVLHQVKYAYTKQKYYLLKMSFSETDEFYIWIDWFINNLSLIFVLIGIRIVLIGIRII